MPVWPNILIRKGPIHPTAEKELSDGLIRERIGQLKARGAIPPDASAEDLAAAVAADIEANPLRAPDLGEALFAAHRSEQLTRPDREAYGLSGGGGAS